MSLFLHKSPARLGYGATVGRALLLLLFGSACGEGRTGDSVPNEPVRPLTVTEARVVEASNAFGLALLRDLHAAESKPNLFVSPLSVSLALGMTLNGAVGETFAAMSRTLGFEGLPEAEINAAYKGLIRQLSARDPKVQFAIANSVWHERTFTVHPAFLEALQTHFDAEVAALDFRDPGAPDAINDWVTRETGGRIRRLIETIDPLEVMFLVNAVYFKGPWTSPFEPNGTRPGPFTRADGSQVTVPLMHGDASHPSFTDDVAQVVELLYAESAYGMVLVAPSGGGSLAELVAGLTSERWDAWTSSLQAGRILLTMPKFRFEYGATLNEALDRLGMGIAFEPFRADFTRIADVDDLHISRVEHKTFVDVHELGTEAAAATAVGVGVTSAPPEVRFDRPFLFAIRERASGTILFFGIIGDPSAS